MEKTDITVLIVSNGYGEDWIAARLCLALRALNPNIQFEIVPLVGEGLHYLKSDLRVRTQNPIFPSGGFIRTFNDLYGDLKAGLLGHIFEQRKILKTLDKKVDIVICIGDIFCLWMGHGTKIKTVFLPTAKSNLIDPHSKLEKWLMRRWCRLIYTRDKITCTDLKVSSLPAHFLGNIMLDKKVETRPLPLNPNAPVLGLLPGSREEAYPNVDFMLSCVNDMLLSQPNLQICLAKAPSLSTKRLVEQAKQHGWILKSDLSQDNLLFSHEILDGSTLVISENFESCVETSWVLFGLSGTANEQAVYWGKTVVCCPGFGPQSTALRFEEQHRLLGDRLIFEPHQQNVADQLLKHLVKPNELLKKETSRSSAHAIAEHILAQL